MVTGPESSGKTTLVDRLRVEYGVPTVSEFARTYLDHLDRMYTYDDLQKIAISQNTQEAAAHDRYPIIICDTDIITIDIWSLKRFGKSIEVANQLEYQKYYLLCRPDIPWEYDPQRENPLDRQRLFEVYMQYLDERSLSYEVLEKEERDKWKPQ